MKIILLVAALLGTGIAQGEYSHEFTKAMRKGADTFVEITVVDDDGLPVSNALVSVCYNIGSGREETHGPTDGGGKYLFVAVYDTRVEITSPGGLPRGLTAEKAISGCSKIRNKALAEALSYMRYVEGWGSGFLRVNEELADYGAHPVEIEDAGIATHLNVYRVAANAQSDRHEGNEGNRECNHEPNEPNRAPNDTNGGTNGTNQIVECLRETPSISLDELAKRIGVSRRTIVRMIDRLKKQGSIRRKGGTRGVWEVL